MVDKLTTVRRLNVTQRIGRLSSTQIVDMERLVVSFLGLADLMPDEVDDILLRG